MDYKITIYKDMPPPNLENKNIYLKQKRLTFTTCIAQNRKCSFSCSPTSFSGHLMLLSKADSSTTPYSASPQRNHLPYNII